jgi:hypothetical protein
VIETSRYACNATLPVRPMRNSSVNDDGEYGPSPHYRIRSGAPDDVRVNHEVGITHHELKWLGIPSWNAWSNRLDPRSQMARP